MVGPQPFVMFLALVLASSPAISAEGNGAIDRACQAADRPTATPQLCGCLQSVANQTLSSADRRAVAKFFSEPNRAQKVKMSTRRGDERLWKRYTAFGELAQAVCS